jgi:hypothetical protein
VRGQPILSRAKIDLSRGDESERAESVRDQCEQIYRYVRRRSRTVEDAERRYPAGICRCGSGVGAGKGPAAAGPWMVVPGCAASSRRRGAARHSRSRAPGGSSRRCPNASFVLRPCCRACNRRRDQRSSAEPAAGRRDAAAGRTVVRSDRAPARRDGGGGEDAIRPQARSSVRESLRGEGIEP